MLNPMTLFSSVCDKQFLKNNNCRQIFHILFILTGENAFQLLEGYVVRFGSMLNAMALVASHYGKQFIKNHNFRRHLVENGVQNNKNGMGHMKQSSLGLT